MINATAYEDRSARERGRSGPAYFFHPIVDFLCLGGASLIVLPLLALLLPVESSKANVAAIAMMIAHAVNHPHFAHSYQIFYRNFRQKIFGSEYRAGLRARYVFAGIVAPALLATCMAVSVVLGSASALGFTANAMLLLVGWHYAKQGYGMVIVDSVLKRQFFADAEKKTLLINAYACWLVTWLGANRAVAAQDLWGLTYYTFALPELLWQAAVAVAAVTTLATGVMLIKRWRGTGAVPVNGVVAYVASLYVWLIFARINPLFIFVIPAFHSLQYLLVVWRYQFNIENSRPRANETSQIAAFAPRRAILRLARFAALGLILGFCGFWLAPILLDEFVAYDKALFGPSMFLFAFWIFINVHHYFLDNVMWRRENPDTRTYLFAHH